MNPDTPDGTYKVREKQQAERTLRGPIDEVTDQGFVDSVQDHCVDSGGDDLRHQLAPVTIRNSRQRLQNLSDKVAQVESTPSPLAIVPQTVGELLLHPDHDRILKAYREFGLENIARTERALEGRAFGLMIYELLDRDISTMRGGATSPSDIQALGYNISDDFAQTLFDLRNTGLRGTLLDVLALTHLADPDAETIASDGTITPTTATDMSAYFFDRQEYGSKAENITKDYHHQTISKLEERANFASQDSTVMRDTGLGRRAVTLLKQIQTTPEYQQFLPNHPQRESAAYILTVSPSSRDTFYKNCIIAGITDTPEFRASYNSILRTALTNLIVENKDHLVREDVYQQFEDLARQFPDELTTLRVEENDASMLSWRRACVQDTIEHYRRRNQRRRFT